MDRLLNAKEVAMLLNVSACWVRQHADGSRRPKLPSVKLGTTVRFRLADVERFVRECERAA